MFLNGSDQPKQKVLTGDEITQSLDNAWELKALWNKKSLEQALGLFQNASSRYADRGDLSEAASSLREAGLVQRTLGDKDGSLASLKKSLDLARRADNIAEEVKTLSELSSICFELGLGTSSHNYIRRAETLTGKTSDPSALATVFWALGDFDYFHDELTDSENNLLRSIELWKQVGDLKGEYRSQISLGYVYTEQNKYDLALTVFAAALTNSQNVNDRKGTAESLKAIGTANYLRGDPQTALSYYNQSLGLFPEDIDWSERAVVYNGTGSIYEYFGDYENSVRYREKALELFKKDKFIYGEMSTLNSLGKNSFFLGDDTKAEQYFLEVKDLAIKQASSSYVAFAYLGMGDVFLKRDEREKALRCFNKAKTLVDPRSNRRQLATVYSKIGNTYLVENKLGKAEHYLNLSLNLNRVVKDQFSEADIYYKLSDISLARNDLEKALLNAKKSTELTESTTGNVVNSLLKTSYLSSVHDRYGRYINLLMRTEKEKTNQDYPLRALEASERARARTMLENIELSEANFTKDAPPDKVQSEKELSDLLNAKRSKLTELLSSDAYPSEVKKAEDEEREVERQLEDVKTELKRISPIYSAIKNPVPFDAQKLQGEVLDDNSVFLEFSVGKDESYLWVIDKSEITHYSLPSRERLESQIGVLLEILKAREPKRGESIESYNARVSEADQQYPTLAAELSRELLGEAAGKLKGKRLIISPDGKMGYLPFGALPFPNSGSAPLLATNEIIYAPSASILNLLKDFESDPPHIPAKDLLVFADPVFSASDERLGTVEPDQRIFQTSLAMMRSANSIKELERLPASQTEAAAISTIVSDTTVVSGFSANRERVLNADLADYRVIHFATHGILNEKNPDLAGILLSLYDEKGNPSEGFVRTADIYGMKLNADMVVLSSCNSGVGKEVRGEGIMSLSTAFLQAGARSVVSSLWKVDDNATDKLMREFYQAMANGAPPAQALRQVQIVMMHDERYQSPYYWAAFTVQGNAIRKVTFSSTRSVYPGIIIGAAVLGFIVFLVRRQTRFVKSFTRQ